MFEETDSCVDTKSVCSNISYKSSKTYTRILKAHPHSMSGSSIWASLECHCCFWIAGGLVSYFTMWLLILQLFKNSIDTQEKLRLIEPPLIECEWAFRASEFTYAKLYCDPLQYSQYVILTICLFRPVYGEIYEQKGSILCQI